MATGKRLQVSSIHAASERLDLNDYASVMNPFLYACLFVSVRFLYWMGRDTLVSITPGLTASCNCGVFCSP